MINKNRLIQTFLDLVQIDSPTGEEFRVAEYIKQSVKPLNFELSEDIHGNIIVKTGGTLGEPLLLGAHMDTVEPGRGVKPILKDGLITSDGTTILGMDNKSGVALILELLYSIHEQNVNHIPIEAVFTVAEEIGCVGASKVDYTQLHAKRGLTFDNYSCQVGTITNKSFNYMKLDIDIYGKETHASDVFEYPDANNHGISAIMIAAKAICKFPARLLTPITSINFGTIDAGNVRNTVPGFARLSAEIRSFSDEELLKYSNLVKQTFEDAAKDMNGRAEIHLEQALRGFYIDPEKSTFLQDISNHISEHGLEINYAVGGSDANVFNTVGIETFDISVGGAHEHTLREELVIDDLEKITIIVYSYITKGRETL